VGGQFASPILENGSGLSRIEKITATSAAQLLKVASLHPQGNIFLQSLPIVGVDGTAKVMGSRLGNSPAIGKVFVKTGTLKDVVAIAGYAIATSGKRYIVVGMINHDNAPMARPALDALIEYAVKDEEVQLVAFRGKKKRLRQ
jgi:D-alanyl-D-alanine carboxypeptidase/D-alanyl-D-alanine-endopeptidase (penicillin-binding protein 4)